MWDKPAVLALLTDLLVVAALLGLLYGSVLFAVRSPVFSITEVRLAVAPVHVTREQIEQIVRREVRGTFFTQPLVRTRSAFETLPWVRRAEIRRRWPGGLDVTLAEHRPIARWGSAALINEQGEVFEAAYDGTLPVFNGPADAAKEMAIQYDHFRRNLAALGKTPVQLSLSQRRAWQIRLDDGMTLDLGREQIEDRLRRFVAAYPVTLARVARPVDRVDLRYANGFAARVPGLPPVASARPGGGA
ncbi:MAG: cell division protein FtsQ/DivIB [Burkholderiales bacterium]